MEGNNVVILLDKANKLLFNKGSPPVKYMCDLFWKREMKFKSAVSEYFRIPLFLEMADEQ